MEPECKKFRAMSDDPEELYDVFICFSYKDIDVAEIFKDKLEARGLKCFFSADHFNPGDTIPKNIKRGIDNSKKLLLLVSRNWVKSRYIKMEVEYGRLKDHEKINNRYVVIEEDFSLHDRDFPKDIVETCEEIRRYTEDQKDNEDFWEELCHYIRRDTERAVVAPWGDIAHGICWTYFYGFLNIVLPELRRNFEEWCQKNPQLPGVRVVERLLVICPKHPLKKRLADYENIEKKPCIEMSTPRAGHFRNYDLNVYSVTSNSNGAQETFEVPMTLNWSLMSIEKMTNDDYFRLPQDHLHVQQVICMDKLRMLINRKMKGHWKAQIIEYDEHGDTQLAELIAKKCRIV